MRSAFLMAAIVLIVGGCSASPAADTTSRSCTALGCQTSLAFELSSPLADDRYDVEVCLGGQCYEGSGVIGDVAIAGVDLDYTLELDFRRVELIPPPGCCSSPTVVSLSITESDGMAVVLQSFDDVQFERFTPNGPDCPPTCFIAVIQVARS